MKLLLDENLSPRLAPLLKPVYPGSAHVHEVELGSASDAAVWAYARDNGFVIVSKDSDFVEMSVLRGAPPKLVWIRVGNCSTELVLQLLCRHRPQVESLGSDNHARFCVIE